MEIKYLICPGKIISETDGDEHYISAQRLIELYGVNPEECKIVDSPQSAFGLKWNDYIELRPRTDGNYKLI